MIININFLVLQSSEGTIFEWVFLWLSEVIVLHLNRLNLSTIDEVLFIPAYVEAFISTVYYSSLFQRVGIFKTIFYNGCCLKKNTKMNDICVW